MSNEFLVISAARDVHVTLPDPDEYVGPKIVVEAVDADVVIDGDQRVVKGRRAIIENMHPKRSRAFWGIGVTSLKDPEPVSKAPDLLDELVKSGRPVDFYGVDCNVFCIGKSGERFAFEAVEDENDGYRSMLEELRPVPVDGHIFSKTPIARVVVEDCPELSGYRLRQAAAPHVWLELGTDYSDDYYPMFIFRYTPPQPASAQ
jgi:hypothetical protein